MRMILHDEPRPGFTRWRSDNNVPGKEANAIANMAYPDSDRAPPRLCESKAHNVSNKTPTGEQIARKVRDRRLRQRFTGTMHFPRLTKKTNPRDIKYQEKVDFEAAIEAYKQGKDQYIKAYKAQEFIVPEWVKEALADDEAMTHIKPEQQVAKDGPARA